MRGLHLGSRSTSLVLASVALVVAACSAPSSPPPASPPGPILSSPGPLIASHAALACTDCHVDDSPQIALAKCTSCHTSLAARIAANQGLHAQGAVRTQACNECHADHRGARYDSRWTAFGSPSRFDHALTGWALGKGHRVACDKCHLGASSAASETSSSGATSSGASSSGASSSGASSSSVFVGASRQCTTCHSSPHAGTVFANRDCGTCHSPTFATFKTTEFDHDVAFPIGTSHRHVACAACHTPQLGTARPPTACASCHASRDPHNGRFSAFGKPPACQKCHVPTMSFAPGQPLPAWKPNNFDHTRDGKWQLTGKHADLACRACHTSASSPTFAPLKAGNDCMGCHEHQKVHDKKYANKQCTQCHVAAGSLWIQKPNAPATVAPSPSPSAPSSTPAPSPTPAPTPSAP